MPTRLLLLLLRFTSRWPLAWQAAFGRAIGAIAYRALGSRRKVALRNLALCFPEKSAAERVAIAKAHFGWLGRSLVERGLLWHASPERLRRLIRVEGDIGLAERGARPVMWLVPHFVGLDVAGMAVMLFQRHGIVSVYQEQSDKAVDAALRRARSRFGKVELTSRDHAARAVARAVRKGYAFFNLPDMDFGTRDAAFVPFFGVPTATLLAPSRLAKAFGMAVQPVVTGMLPGGQGYVVRFGEPWHDFPSDDPVADAARMNRWIEDEIRRNPAQYLWVHRRFKSRPEGAAALY